jgi:hypothetical protein
MSSILGAIFPISSDHIERIFDQGRNIFLKFTNLNRLQKNSKIVFYVSRKKSLFGEGTIKMVERLDPKTAWARYGKDIFLNEDEFEDYITMSSVSGDKRRKNEIMVFVLKDLKKYHKTNPSKVKMTPAGCYFSREEYQKMVKE